MLTALEVVSVLDRKLRRDLYAARGLLTAIVVILSLGVSAYVANLSLYFNLERARSNYYGQCRMADFWVDIQKIPRVEVERLAQVSGISELQSRIVMAVTIDLQDEPKPVSGQLISMPADPQPIINGLLLKEGTYFTEFYREEVILSYGFAKARGIRPGDRLRVILNDHMEELLVVGTAISPEFLFARAPGAMIPDKSTFAQLYVKREFAEEATSLEGAANQLCGLLAPEFRSRPGVVLETLEDLLIPFGEATSTQLSEQGSNQQLSSDLAQIRSINLIVPSVFLCVSALILDVLMMRMAQQQRTIIGTLKALGYTNFQLLAHFLKFGIVIGLSGGVVGAAFGYWLAGVILTLFNQLYELPNIVNRTYPSIVGGCLALGVIVACVGTLRGVWQVIALMPAEAMRPKPPEAMRRVALEGLQTLWRKLDFRWQMVFRSLTRNRIRTFTNIFSSAMGTALILQTLQVSDALNELLEFTFEQMLVSDFDLTFKDELDFDAYLAVSRLPGVDDAEPVLNVACTFYHGHRKRQGALSGIFPGARLTVPQNSDGTLIPIPDYGIMLSDALARKLQAQVGDTISFVPTKGERRQIRIPVAAIVQSYVGMTAYANFKHLNQLLGEELSLNAVQAVVDSRPTVVHAFYQQLKQIPALQGFAAIREQKAQLKQLLAPVDTINSLLIVFAGLLCCGSIITSSLISLAERRQEIATFRVLGYQPHQIGAIFLRESLLVNSVGIVLGLPIGYWFARYIVAAVGTDTTRLPFIITPTTWYFAVALSLLFTAFGFLPVYRAINRMNWKEVLSVRE